MKDDTGIRNVIEQYGDMLYRLCIVMLKNEADAEDAVQETFIKYLQKAPDFSNTEHQKAWLIRTATNKCKDILRFRIRHYTEPEEVLYNYVQENESSHILEALMSIPEKFRIVLTLYYVEEYKTDEIAQIIGKSTSAVKMRLSKGRKLLEEKYRKEFM